MITKSILLNKVTDKGNKRIVFNVEAHAGFYSEFNNMLFCLVFCLEKNISFDIQSKGDINFYNAGWGDYFQPFFKEIKLPFLNKYNSRPYLAYGIKFYMFKTILKTIYNIDYFTQDLFDQARADYKHGGTINIPELNVNCSFLEFCSELIKIIYVFNASTRKEMNDLLKNLSLPEDYIAIHIRSGDKIQEVPLYSQDDYIKHAIGKTNNLYVYSDNYEIIEKIKIKYNDFNIYSLTEKNDTGYIHNDFVKLPPLERKKKMTKLFANIEIFCNANTFIGSIDSNPGMFVWMSRAGKNCIDVNGREFMIY